MGLLAIIDEFQEHSEAARDLKVTATLDAEVLC
jgi:hypothetical protein